ncbi:MAG: MarR family winged helix-turn-helix transcriptional regulator [Acidimicrobiales bacterium]
MTSTLPPDSGRIVARLARSMETALGEADLSPSQYRVLSFLSEDGANAAATALAGRMAVSKPSITALVDGLVHRGLVERRPNVDDRRRVQHVVTAAGLEALERADTAVNARLEQLIGLLEPDERDAAGPGLAQWGHALIRARAARHAADTPDPQPI